jgi:uncharacterized membrane protein
MQLALFNMNGFLFLLRWMHFFFGIIWIGLLYYFNFVQGSYFAETDAPSKSNAIQKLVPRALWWFRWGAMYTFLSGLIILIIRFHNEPVATSWGIPILVGGILGTLMWANVWFVIWPNQKIVIASATQAAGGGQAIPTAAAAGARATVASRTNVLFSIPMLFFMGAATHLGIAVNPDANFTILWVVVGAILAGLEFNALKGKTGPLTTVKGVITCGFALAAVLYFVLEFLTK